MNQGLRTGLVLAAVALVITSVYDAGFLPSWVQAVEFVIIAVGTGVAGYLAARQSGRLGSAVIAGAVAAVLAGVVITGANVVMAAVAPVTYAKDFGYHNASNTTLLVTSITSALIGVVIWAIVGVILGAIGGFFGRGRAAARAAN